MAAKRKKRLKKAWLWLRIRNVRLKRWWFRHDRRSPVTWRLGNGALALLMLVAVVIPVLQQLAASRSYLLSADTLKLIGATDPKLAKQLTYDGSTATYQFNKGAIKSDDADPLKNLQSQVGTADGQGKNKSLYALDVPQSISKGVTYHDINSGLSFSMVPEFSARSGQEVQGHLVFPLGDSTQAIYTLKNNGLKEDIVVQKATSDTMSFRYHLNLPKTLAIKPIPNSGGAIGVYSADPALFGNISFGTDADRALVEKAREKGDKTQLVFGIPSPVIRDTGGNNVGSARFELNGDELSVVATGLSDIHAPVTIDPSVVVTSTSDFQTGNVDDNIDFSSSGQITRGGLTGGSISAGWSAGGTSFTTARYGAASVAYNGYLYVIGGCGQITSLTACTAAHYLSDIQYTALNTSTGAFSGSWASAGSSLGAGAYGLSAVAYNGYLYVTGGYNGTTYNNAVQSIPINTSTGAITGSWNASAGSFTNGRYLGAAAVYNDYLYILGGYNGTTYYNDVQYGVLNADGTVGSIHYTHSSTDDSTSFVSGFTTGRFGLSAVAYNGYLYVVGGCSAGTCTTYKSDTQYAPLNANGTVGSWNTGTSFTTARFGQAVDVYNGYMYLAGGNSGSYQTDSQFAQVNANGSLGTWATANSSNNLSADAEASTAAYNGYIYVVGGSVSGTLAATSQFAAINAAAKINAYATSGNTLAGTAVTQAASIAYRGHIYYMGGNTGAADVIATQYATIASDGTIGSWTTSNNLLDPNQVSGGAVGVASSGVAAWNGYLYIVGGLSTGGAASSIVQYSLINTSTGALGTWTHATHDFPVTTGNHDTITYNGYLYARGNGGGGANTVLHYALICTGSNNGVGGCNSTAGNVGTWNTTTNSLITSRTNDKMVAYNGYLYIAGGTTSGTTSTAVVEYALICDGVTTAGGCSGLSAGDLGTMNSATAMGTARDGFGLVPVNGYLCALGGETNNSAISTTECGPILSTGSVGTWSSNTSFAQTYQKAGFSSYNGMVYAAGGSFNGSRTTNVLQAAFNNGGSGDTSSWTTNGTNITGAYSSGWQDGQLFASGGYLYAIGGDNGATDTANTYSAPINADGSVGSWSAQATMSSRRHGFALSVYNGYVYVYGGTANTTELNTYEYASIGTGGTLGSWSSDTSMGAGVSTRTNVSGAVYNGYLYILGGTHSGTALTDVYYVAINSDGTLATWTSTTGFATARSSAGAMAYAGYLYILGGQDNSSNYLQDVQVTALNSNGTVAGWTTTTWLARPQAQMRVVAANGFIYAVAGATTSGTALATIDYTPILAGGELGAWQQANGGSFSTARTIPGVTLSNGTLYLAGGLASGSAQSDIQYTTMKSIALTGHYSRLIDLGSSTNVTGLSYSNGAGNSFVAGSVSYRAAGSNAIFGSATPASTISGAGGCAGNLANTRYLLVSITVDDSIGAGTGGFFPDYDGVSNGTGTSNVDASVGVFTVNYNATHPTPNIRLRGGKSLQAGVLSPLDTCGA
ncbi:MAG TPA: hypothetical protein VLF69_00770 [Candidatus Saccharimonadales bacterium]|nr:hypothetical protein [Candidatus Saccharimonadales bacterium]